VKQTLFMIVVSALGICGVFVLGPFTAIAVYYLFAVLRPQYLWQWALPQGVQWSQWVALAAILSTPALLIGMLPLGGARDRFPGWSRTHWLLLAFGVWVCLTYFTAQSREVAWPWFLEYLKIFAMFAVASLVVRNVRQVWVLYVLAALSLGYIAYEVNYVYLLQGRLDIYHSGYGGLDNNGAGLMLAMGVPLCIYAWDALNRWWRWVFALAVPLLLHAVLMTYSRGAMVSLIVASPLFVLRSRRRWQAAAFALVLLAIVPVLAGTEIRQRFFTLETYQSDSSATSRFESWKAAIGIANSSPIIGAGIRNSNLLSHEYGADVQGRTIHSQYLQTLADSGYPALFLYLWAIGSVFWSLRAARRRLKGRDDDESKLVRSMAAGVEGGLLVFCVGAVFLSLEVFELPYLLLLMGAQLGVLTRESAAAVAAPAAAGAPGARA
jgi:probable O-glycosylation ligase (exosortase A-associated)